MSIRSYVPKSVSSQIHVNAPALGCFISRRRTGFFLFLPPSGQRVIFEMDCSSAASIFKELLQPAWLSSIIWLLFWHRWLAPGESRAGLRFRWACVFSWWIRLRSLCSVPAPLSDVSAFMATVSHLAYHRIFSLNIATGGRREGVRFCLFFSTCISLVCYFDWGPALLAHHFKPTYLKMLRRLLYPGSTLMHPQTPFPPKHGEANQLLTWSNCVL